LRATLSLALLALSAPLAAQQTVGRPAADFRLMSAEGKPVKLSDFRGRMVVLEWNDPGCLYARRQYMRGDVQRAQGVAQSMGAVWLTISSAAPGTPGFVSAAAARSLVKQQHATPTAYLLDPQGVVGRRYGATKTPQVALIAPDGRLAYQGAIDNRPSTNTENFDGARSYILDAMRQVKAGKRVAVPNTRPYGCAIDYAKR
jgi:hypothetical protein